MSTPPAPHAAPPASAGSGTTEEQIAAQIKQRETQRYTESEGLEPLSEGPTEQAYASGSSTATASSEATPTETPVPATPAATDANVSMAGNLAAATVPPAIAKPSTFLVRPAHHARVTRSDPIPVPNAQRRPLTPTEKDQMEGLRAIRSFLKVRTSYDVLPLSYRLIVLDTSLLVKKSLNILTQCGIVSAPLWDSKTSTFAGLLTTSDFINVVQYYWQNPDALAQIDQFKLSSLREIERSLGVIPIETVSMHPMAPLVEACRCMLQSRARRIPLIDLDDETKREMVVTVLTQYRIVKFICVNVKETQWLRIPLRDLPQMGTYSDVCFAYMDTPVNEVIQMLVNRSISSVPILDRDGSVLNVFEAVDVIMLIKGGDYENLNLSVGKALEKRQDDFPGIYTCTLNDRLDTIFDTVRKSRVHRFVVVDEARQLKGLLSLSDILDYTLNSPIPEEVN